MKMLLLLIVSVLAESSSAVYFNDRQGVARQSSISFQCPSDGLYCTECTNSVFCTGGNALEFACGEGEVCAGAPGFAGCRPYVGEDAGECDCDSVGNSGFLADPYDPAKYIICVPPEAQFFVSCTGTQVFNDATNACEDLPPAPECTEVGFFTNDATCKSYYICTSASLPGIQLTCPTGQAFDSSKNTCVDQCSLGPASFTCPSNGNGAFPDTTDCSIFHVCSNGALVASSISCPDGELFNSETKTCVTNSASVRATCPAINPCWSTYCETCGTSCDFVVATDSPSDSTPVEVTSSPTIVKDSTAAPLTTPATPVTQDPAKLDRLPCQCGQVVRTDGNKHHLYNHPWTVALLNTADDKHFCSGTIVNTKYILTAASCVEGKTVKSFEVRANEHVLGSKLPRAVTRTPGRIVTNGDIALIELRTSISLTNYEAVKPACLPGPNMDFAGDAATHSGFDHGKNMKNEGTLSTGTSANQLNFDPSGHAFCREDVGGPVVSGANKKEYLAGIAIDTTCSTSRQPVAKISEYYDWIYDNSNNGRFCQQ